MTEVHPKLEEARKFYQDFVAGKDSCPLISRGRLEGLLKQADMEGNFAALVDDGRSDREVLAEIVGKMLKTQRGGGTGKRGR